MVPDRALTIVGQVVKAVFSLYETVNTFSNIAPGLLIHFITLLQPCCTVYNTLILLGEICQRLNCSYRLYIYIYIQKARLAIKIE